VQPEVTQTWDLLHTLNSEEEKRWDITKQERISETFQVLVLLAF